MGPEIPIFKPRYPLGTRLVILIPSVLFFTLLCGVATTTTRFPVLFWFLVLVIGLVISLIPFFTLREVRFLDEMVVRRHFLPDRFFSYKELDQFDTSSIQAGGWRIRLGQIGNFSELKEMSQRWKAARILKESHSPRPTKESLYFQRGYGTYASFWGLIFSIIIMNMVPSRPQIDPRLVLGGTFLFVYYMYGYIVPKYF